MPFGSPLEGEGVLDHVDVPVGAVVSFGPYRLAPTQQLLLESEKPVRIGSRALEILIALVERPGELVSKQALMDRVWPNTFVEEGSLRVHVAALRRALRDGQAGNRYITNIPGRGYCFVAPLTLSEEETAIRLSKTVERPIDLPLPLARVVGRSDIVDVLVERLQRQRFITVVGPGGIGKTTVAVAVAESLLGTFRDGVRFVDLAPLTDPLLVPSALAAQLGLGVHSGNPLPSLIAFLREKQILVVLDNCEHVIDAAAALAEQIFNGTKGTHILATSREALRVEGERVHRLAPLAFPAQAAKLKAAEALNFPAVQLFVERAAASLGAFDLSDAEAPFVADICRRLDGIALAIEIAASRVDAFGVAGLAARLDDRFRLLMQGRRTALPRHKTLSATLDWSYAQLPQIERLVLRRLAIFAGAFTMESASAVLVDADTSAAEVVDAIANLIAKSLVSADLDGPIALYRLLETTRAYVLSEFEETGERGRLARLHAEHYRDLLEQAQTAWETRPATEWLDQHRHLMGNVRAALDWASPSAGDPATGVALTLAAVPLWFTLSLTSECAERVDRALAAPAASRNAEREMRLYATRGWCLMQTRGSLLKRRPPGPACSKYRSGWAMPTTSSGLFGGCGQGFSTEANSVPLWRSQSGSPSLRRVEPNGTDPLIGNRMVGYILHLMGDQEQARRYIERMLDRYEAPTIGAQIIRFVFDQRATAQCFLARILWLQGSADQAVGLVKSIVDGALASDDVLTSCQVLVQAACPVALAVGDLEAAGRYVAMLLDQSARQDLDFWQAYGRCFEGMLVIRRGKFAEGLGMLRTSLEELREIQFGVYYGVFLSEYAAALGHVGRATEGLAAIDEALARSERNDERWYLAELLRIKGDLVLRQGGADAPFEAERHYLQSLDWSRRQQTIAWELRATISLGALWRDQDRADDARNLVASCHGRFAEGFGTADVQAAKRLLAELD